jgi:RNA ligase
MKLLDYLGIDVAALTEYINQGLIDTAHHPEFPLVLFSYGRKAVSENIWEEPVRKCRGLIVHEGTDEIVARPFEKFFNLDTAGMPETTPAAITREPDRIDEKLDGFLCTLYQWLGKQYIASKGSFTSTHAKWATAEYNKGGPYLWPWNYTPVFEGITPSLRIVVDYGDREGLTLLALINNETGEEIDAKILQAYAERNGFHTPAVFNVPWQKASELSLSDAKNFEGYVLVWNRPGMTPFRLKVKYIDYLRIHRMVCGTSPKRIFQVLSGEGWRGDMDTWLDNSTPWFNKFVAKWKNALEVEYANLNGLSELAFSSTMRAAKASETFWTRKQWAEEFKKEDSTIVPILFARLDGKDVAPVIWKKVKHMVTGSQPMIDASKM